MMSLFCGFNACTNLCLQLSVLWKLVEKILIPKPARNDSLVKENKPVGDQTKWSFNIGGDMLSGLSAKLDRQAKQKLNDFSKELRSLPVVDLSGILK